MNFSRFSLKTYTLGQALNQAARAQSFSRYKLFAFLLATPADHNVFPELLLHFREIDWLTGKHILVIAPSIYIGSSRREATREETLEVLSTGVFPQYLPGVGKRDVSEEIHNFMKAQTAQTYELVEFLDLSRNDLPAILFFEQLTYPGEFVIWKLEDVSVDHIVHEFRSIVDTLCAKCNWDVAERINKAQADLNSKDWRVNTYQQRIEIETLENSIRKKESLLHLLVSIKDVSNIYDALKKDKPVDEKFVPYESVYKNIKRLEENPLDGEAIFYIQRHRRRWMKRMPQDYLDALARLFHAASHCHVDKQNLDTGIGTLDDRIHLLNDEIGNIAQIIQGKNENFLHVREVQKKDLEQQLVDLKRRADSPTQMPLEVLRTLYNQSVAKRKFRGAKVYPMTDELFMPNRESDRISILFLAADPTNAARLRLDEELREIQERLQLAAMRDRFFLAQRMAVRPADLSQSLLDVKPRIVHFSGHGDSSGALCLEDKLGETHPVQPEALTALFEIVADNVDCVILNACYSERQANAIAKHIKCVIGMSQAISDKAAIAFAIGFYQALGAGRSIDDAYKFGCVQIRLQNIPEHLTPVLVKMQT